MKNWIFFCTVLSIAFFLSACKSSTSPNGGGNQNNAVMTATVNGKPWNGIIPGNGTLLGHWYINAGDDSSVITLYFSQTDTGTFDVGTFDTVTDIGDPLFCDYFLHTTDCWSIPHSGTVHFTTLTSTKAAGTFSFRAINPNTKDTISIINGTFNNPR